MPKPDKQTDVKHRNEAREHARRDDPTRDTHRQIDDNQDDLGRDVNDPSRVGNEINRQPVRGAEK